MPLGGLVMSLRARQEGRKTSNNADLLFPTENHPAIFAIFGTKCFLFYGTEVYGSG